MTQTTPSNPPSPRTALADLALAGGMYFGYYAGLAAMSPFLSLYYQRAGLTSQQIGILVAVPVLVSSSTALIWGAFADRFHLHRVILRVALMLVPLPALILSNVTQFELLLALIAVYAFFITPIVPLIDSGAIEAAQKHGRTYGDLRVWGTIGWSVSTSVVGSLIQNQGIRWMFYMFAIAMAFTFILSLFTKARSQMMRASIREGLSALLLRRDFAIFLISIFLVAVASAGVNSFLSLHLDSIGANEGTIGLAFTLSAVSEIPTLFLSRAILKRISAATLLKIAFTVYAVRWMLLSFATTPALAVATQLMHGASFGAFLVGGVTYMNQHTPEGMGATAQAIYTTVSYGLATIVGATVGGYLFDRLDHGVYYRLLSGLVVVGLALFMTNRERPTATAQPADS